MQEARAGSTGDGHRAVSIPALGRYLLIFGIGVAAGAPTLGAVPWPSPPSTAVSLLVLVASGMILAATRTRIRGLAALYLGLLAGLALVLWLRISLAESGLGGMRSLTPVGEWRVGCAASVAAGMISASLGYVVGGRRSDAGRQARPVVVLGASVPGSAVFATVLAIYLGTTALVIPEGAVILHVTVTDGKVALDPATIPAGEVHFIRSQRGHRYDGPFFVSGTGPQGTAGHIFEGPLTDADVAKLQLGQLPGGTSLVEIYGDMPAGEPVPWPTPDEYGGRESLAPGRYAWWTLEVGDFPGGVRFRDVALFTVDGSR